MSTSKVARLAPWAVAASPPTSAYSTWCSASARKIAVGSIGLGPAAAQLLDQGDEMDVTQDALLGCQRQHLAQQVNVMPPGRALPGGIVHIPDCSRQRPALSAITPSAAAVFGDPGPSPGLTVTSTDL